MAAAPSVAERRAPTTGGTQRVDRRFPILIGLVAVLYILAGTWTFSGYNVDAYTNVLQARSFAADQSVVVADADHLADPPYFQRMALLVRTDTGAATSQYPPGVALWAAPFYLLDSHAPVVNVSVTNAPFDAVDLPVPSPVPGTLAAIVATVLALVFFGLTLRRQMSEEAMLVCVAVMAFGTGAWSVAADQLWQHGPDMLWISLGVYLASTDRFARSGLAFGAALLTRPHTAVIAAAVGLAVSIRRRELAPVIRLGAGSGLGLVVLVVYNRLVFGVLSISGGYGSAFTDRAVDAGGGGLWLLRLGEALVDPDFGLLVTSPFLVLAFVAVLGRTWRAPDWALGAAIGALGYALLQYKANRASGGELFFGYRYPLEPLMAAAPLLAIASVDWARSRRRRLAMLGLVAASVALNAYGALFVSF